jgi:predicted phosphodiesterase
MGKKVLVVPDTHFPWCDYEKLSLIYEIAKTEKPDFIIQIGDLFDLYSHSKYARGHDLCTPQQEILEARQAAENMWSQFSQINPKSSLVQLKGNHDARIEKRVYEKYPEIASLLDLNHLWQFKGVETLLSDRDSLEIDGVIYVHGWLTRIGQHMNYFNKPVVHGHTHRGGIHFEKRGNGVIWELDCGYLADPNAVPLQYGATKTIKWVHGCGLIDILGPRFIPL